MNPIKLISPLSNAYFFMTELPKNVKENIGRFIMFDDTTEVLSNLQTTIKGFDELSKKEKNIFVTILKNINYKNINNNAEPFDMDYFVKLYNEAYDKSTLSNKILDMPKFLKELNTLSEYLKAEPYNDINFSELIYSKYLQNKFSAEFINNKQEEVKVDFDFELIKNSFKNYIDKKTITDYFSGDPEIVNQAKLQLKQIELLKTKKDSRDLIFNTMAGIFALSAIVSFSGVDMASATKMANLVISHVNDISAFMHLNIPVPSVSAMSPLTLFTMTAGAFHTSFGILNGSAKKITELEIDVKNKISFTSPNEINSNFLFYNIKKKLFKDLISDFSLNINEKDTQKYIALSLFLNDKLLEDTKHLNILGNLNSTPTKYYKVNDELKKLLDLPDNIIKNLNTMNRDEINEIASISSPEVRYALLTNEFSEKEKNILKLLSNVKSLSDKKTEDINIENTRIQKIDDFIKDVNNHQTIKFTKNEEIIVKLYGGMLSEKELNLLTSNAFKDKKSFFKNIDTYINIDITTHKKQYPDNSYNYFKKIFGMMFGTSNQRLEADNVNMVSKMKEISEKIGIKHYDEVEKLTNKNKVLLKIEKVFLNIGSIRDKFYDKTADTYQAIRNSI